MRNKFDKQLDRLNVELIDMGQLCEVAIGKATKALEKDSEEIAKEVISADAEIDQKEKEIEQLCLKLILQQQPVAKDLRQISAALKMITDMERIGDQASDIAEIILSAEIKDTRAIPEIVKMASAASAMVRSSVMAYVNKDLDLAKKVLEADDKVDNMFDNIKHKLIEFIAKEGGNQGEDRKISGADRRPRDQYCRVGGIFHHWYPPVRRSHIRKEENNDLLCGR